MGADGKTERLNPDRTYQVRGEGKFKMGLDRVKGFNETYFAGKEVSRMQVIIDQVTDLSDHLSEGAKVELADACS